MSLSDNQTKGSDSLPIPPSGQYCTRMLCFFLQPWSVVCPKMSFPWTIQARDKETEKIIPPHQSRHDQECPQHSAPFPSMWLMYTATNSAFASESSLSLFQPLLITFCIVLCIKPRIWDPSKLPKQNEQKTLNLIPAWSTTLLVTGRA